jgi:phosphoribosylformylglycinamidine synthase
MQAAVIVFPGSNCDRDAAMAIEHVTGHLPRMVWHRDTLLPDVDLVILPGGFSYGDYLRPGAIASRSPIIAELRKHARKGGYVAGICNGFQVLTEIGLLPGVLMRNAGLNFICKPSELQVARNDIAFSNAYEDQETITIPIAHHDGNFFATPDELERLEGEGQVVFRYFDNPNGSRNDIAGLSNEKGNVLGMMPHPERAMGTNGNSTDGIRFFRSIMNAIG